MPGQDGLSGAAASRTLRGPGEAPGPRIRVLVAGQVVRVTVQPVGALPRYEAEIEIDASYRTVVSETATGSASPGPSSAKSSRHQTPAERMRNRGTFAPPTSVIALDMPRFEDEDEAPVSPRTHVRLIWHGQRTVSGIGAGTRLRCSGLLASLHGDPVIYNPRYEIVSRTA